MFKVTRFKQALLYLGLAAVGEESAVVDFDMSAMTDSERRGAVIENLKGMPSTIHLQEFMKEHHLHIPAAIAPDLNANISAPLPTPHMQTSAKSIA